MAVWRAISWHKLTFKDNYDIIIGDQPANTCIFRETKWTFILKETDCTSSRAKK